MMREIIIPSNTANQNAVMRFDTKYLLATYITSNGDLILKFTIGNDNELILQYKDIDSASNVNDYIWGVGNYAGK